MRVFAPHLAPVQETRISVMLGFTAGAPSLPPGLA